MIGHGAKRDYYVRVGHGARTDYDVRVGDRAWCNNRL